MFGPAVGPTQAQWVDLWSVSRLVQLCYGASRLLVCLSYFSSYGHHFLLYMRVKVFQRTNGQKA